MFKEMGEWTGYIPLPRPTTCASVSEAFPFGSHEYDWQYYFPFAMVPSILRKQSHIRDLL
jgi:hypothetical protein